MSAGGDGTVTVLARGEGLAAWRQIADGLSADIEAGASRRARSSRRKRRSRRDSGSTATPCAGRWRRSPSAGWCGRRRGAAPSETPRLAYPIGRRTRFSEIVSQAGREAWGDLLSAESVPADPATAEALGIAAGDPMLELLTIHRADGTPLSTARTCLPLPRFAGFAQAYAALGSLTRAYAEFGIADYTRLSTRITARPAAADEAARLDLAPGRVLIVLSSVNVDAMGVPIQATRSLFAADRVELVVEG